MPLRGEGHSDLVRDEKPYFKSLAELDTWFTQPHDKLSGVLPYQPRLADGQSGNGGKLLVCHDYKGGYSETPSGLCYTFNFWRLCDTFVYFAHHRVTVPPSGWINAAHKQGTRMLGTLIFENFEGYDPDCLQLIVGRANYEVKDNKIPISKRYAVLLAELAHQRGFDGYLINVESKLQYRTNEARALAAWMLLFRAELEAKVGPHAKVMWYDSVIYNGDLWWQDTMNGYNLPLFLASDTFFTNYNWTPQTQDSMIQYFGHLDRSILDPNASTSALPSAATKVLQDIYSGVDFWAPRSSNPPSQYGGGGFRCYRSITHTIPLGISAALFAPAWTWEKATSNAEQNWDVWWDNERQLWLGPLKPENVPSDHFPEDPFKPMTAFFQDLPPPDPSKFAFYTHFSPGVGYSWFVVGRKVMETNNWPSTNKPKGWSDIDKQCSIGNLVWPSPNPSWHGTHQAVALPTASTALDMTDGYNGGNTLKLTLTYTGSNSTIWIPIQSLTVTTRESFEVRVVYKTTPGSDVELDPRIHVKYLHDEKHGSAAFAIRHPITSNLSHGWTQQTLTFSSTSSQNVTSVAVLGFIVGIKPRNPSTTVTFSLSLAQIAVYPSPPPSSVSVGTPSVTEAKFALRQQATTLEGVLTWDTASTLQPVDISSVVVSKESTTPAWLLKDTPAYRFPTFVYFNIYVAQLNNSGNADPASAVFIGTTGLDGRANRFYVEPACLPPNLDLQAGVRLYVQGVTDRGEVLPWDRCTSVDYKKS